MHGNRPEYLKKHKLLLLLLAAAFLLRLGLFFACRPWQDNFIFNKIIMIDAAQYHDFALSVLKNHSFAEAGTFRTPGYPLFLAFFYTLFGVHPWVVIFAQVFLGTALVALVYWWVSLWVPRRTALIAAALYAVDPHAIIYGASLLTETLFVFLVLTAVISWWYGMRKNKLLLIALAGLLTGCAMLTRPIMLLFPVAVIGVSLFFARSWRFKAGMAAVYLAAFSLMLFPWAWRNYQQFGRYAISDGNGFHMLFVNAAYTEVTKTGKSYEQVCNEFENAARARGLTENMNPFSRSDLFLQLAAGHLRQDRGIFLRRYLTGTVMLFLNIASTDTADLLGLKRIQFKYNYYAFDRFSNMITWYLRNKTAQEIAIGAFILLFLLATYVCALFGIAAMIGRKQYSLLAVNLILGLYFIAITGLSGNARYRLPVLPFYVVFSAAGVLQLRELVCRVQAKKDRP